MFDRPLTGDRLRGLAEREGVHPSTILDDNVSHKDKNPSIPARDRTWCPLSGTIAKRAWVEAMMRTRLHATDRTANALPAIRPLRTSDRTRMRCTSRSLMATQPAASLQLIREGGGHFYVAEGGHSNFARTCAMPVNRIMVSRHDKPMAATSSMFLRSPPLTRGVDQAKAAEVDL